jgi:hypothetical protein
MFADGLQRLFGNCGFQRKFAVKARKHYKLYCKANSRRYAEEGKIMYFLDISMANDLEFAIVVGFYGFIALIVMCILTGIIEGIANVIERRRRKKFRKGYVDLRHYED